MIYRKVNNRPYNYSTEFDVSATFLIQLFLSLDIGMVQQQFILLGTLWA